MNAYTVACYEVRPTIKVCTHVMHKLDIHGMHKMEVFFLTFEH
jgi:hypothetical protein